MKNGSDRLLTLFVLKMQRHMRKTTRRKRYGTMPYFAFRDQATGCVDYRKANNLAFIRQCIVALKLTMPINRPESCATKHIIALLNAIVHMAVSRWLDIYKDSYSNSMIATPTIAIKVVRFIFSPLPCPLLLLLLHHPLRVVPWPKPWRRQ
jgi:hypothetical protein